jgi:hypothetical protein
LIFGRKSILNSLYKIFVKIYKRLGIAQFRGENGGFVSVELSKDYHGDG